MHLCAMHLISFTCNQLKDANIMANRKKQEEGNHCMSMKGRTKKGKNVAGINTSLTSEKICVLSP
jgi:hypothetical protein